MDENEKDKQKINEILQAAKDGDQQELKRLVDAYAAELQIEPASMLNTLANILKCYYHKRRKSQ